MDLGPYVTFEPSLAFVAEDAAGIGGYVVATLDSRAFDRRMEQSWWPALRARYPEPSGMRPNSCRLPEQYAIRDIHRSSGAPAGVTDRFPSHLHINLLRRMQGRGTGRRLVTALASRLRAQSSVGLHLLVGDSNQRAIGLYRHIGFTELAATDPHVFTMRLGDG